MDICILPLPDRLAGILKYTEATLLSASDVECIVFFQLDELGNDQEK